MNLTNNTESEKSPESFAKILTFMKHVRKKQKEEDSKVMDLEAQVKSVKCVHSSEKDERDIVEECFDAHPNMYL